MRDLFAIGQTVLVSIVEEDLESREDIDPLCPLLRAFSQEGEKHNGP